MSSLLPTGVHPISGLELASRRSIDEFATYGSASRISFTYEDARDSRSLFLLETGKGPVLERLRCFADNVRGGRTTMRRWLFAMLLLGACGEKKTLDPLDPESFQQFSGTVTVETGGRTDVYDYTRDGSKIRIVPRVAADSKVDQRFAIIVDQEAKTTTAISWGRKQFFVQPLSAKSAPTVGMPLGQPGERPQIMTRKFLEPASLDGHACNVETALMRSPGGAEQHVKVWSAKDLQGFPVRIESHIGSNPLTVTFSGVKLGPAHDPTLFKVPEGFKNAAAGG